MENKRAFQILIVLLVAGLALRVYPPLSYDFLVNFDSIYHARIGQIVADMGWVPTWDPAAGGRPHLYPPLYHLTIGWTSAVTGISAFELVQYVLPFLSALLVFPTFFLIRKYRDEHAALFGAALMAFCPIVISQSYDSPQVFGLLLFPLLVYSFLKGNYPIGGGILALCVLSNYGIVLMAGTVMAAFAIMKYLKGEKKFLVYGGLIFAIGLGLASPWLFISASRAGECFEPSTIVSAVNEPGMSYLLVIAPFVAGIGLYVLYLTKPRGRLASKDDDYCLFWRLALGIGIAGFLASLAMPQLHPYDQLLLGGFSLPFLFADARKDKAFVRTMLIVFIIGSVFSVMAIKPALSSDDLAAVAWVTQNVHEGRILADIEISGAINMYTGSKGIQTSFDQFLECLPDRQRWVDLQRALATKDSDEAQSILDEYDVDYVVVGARDELHYGFDIRKFGGMGLEAVFMSGESIVYEIK